MAKPLIIFLISLSTVFAAFFANQKDNLSSSTPAPQVAPKNEIKMLKDVGEAYMDYFGLTDGDFKNIKNAGFNVIESNFDICAWDEDVEYFLNKSQKYGLKVILPAGSGEAEWGYECDAVYPKDQKPVWQKEKVQAWVNKWKNHPAVYGWDTSNEAGGNFPNGAEFKLSYYDLQTAYRDVKVVDDKPVMIRMNGWYFYDSDHDFFRDGNPFGENVADIVMVNAYSNVEDYYGDFVATVMDRAESSIHTLDPKIKFIVSIGVWSEPPLWFIPTKEELENDLNNVQIENGVIGVAYFKYGVQGSEWYLPTNSPDVWEMLQVTK